MKGFDIVQWPQCRVTVPCFDIEGGEFLDELGVLVDSGVVSMLYLGSVSENEQRHC